MTYACAYRGVSMDIWLTTYIYNCYYTVLLYLLKCFLQGISFFCSLAYGIYCLTVCCYKCAANKEQYENRSTSQPSSLSTSRITELTTFNLPHVQPTVPSSAHPSTPPCVLVAAPSNTTTTGPADVSISSDAPPSYESTKADPPPYETV